MAKYCDSKELETVWSDWEYAMTTPELNLLRDSRRLLKQDHKGCVLHCVPIKNGVFFFGVAGQRVEDPRAIINLVGDNSIDANVASVLAFDNFRFDVPARISWHRLVSMIYSICNGLALKFNPTTDEERSDLAHEAIHQTLLKIHRGKLKFTPGKAPVFNLLTTAILRIMCSIKNKDKRYRVNQAKLAAEVSRHTGLPKYRSLALAAATS